MRREPLTRADGAQIGVLTLDVCDECEAGTEDDIRAFVDRFLSE